MSTLRFRTRLRNGSTVMCIGNGMEGKRKGMEGFCPAVSGVFNSDQIQSDRHLGPLAAPIGFGDGR